jgi:hypothetical protein
VPLAAAAWRTGTRADLGAFQQPDAALRGVAGFARLHSLSSASSRSATNILNRDWHGTSRLLASSLSRLIIGLGRRSEIVRVEETLSSQDGEDPKD